VKRVDIFYNLFVETRFIASYDNCVMERRCDKSRLYKIIGGKFMLYDKVEKVLDKVRTMLQMDGGDIKLVSVDESAGKVIVQLQGACMGCPMSTFTLKNTVERMLKESIPEVKSVESV
jgi:Fe-S cluster biogenesis protein NfuA